MTKKLIRVARRNQQMGVLLDTSERENRLLNPEHVAVEAHSPARLGSFFLVEESEVDAIHQELAEINPGLEVEVYALERSGQCPPGTFRPKLVTKDGILPAATAVPEREEPAVAVAPQVVNEPGMLGLGRAREFNPNNWWVDAPVGRADVRRVAAVDPFGDEEAIRRAVRNPDQAA
jgi:hypothetical protein